MKAFDYAAPESLDAALALFGESDKTSLALAGGTDLIVQMRERGKTCDRIVDIKRVPELTELSFDAAKGLTIGAAVPCVEIYENAEVVANYPGLVDSASLIGGIQIQNRATLGGNLCNASPAADGVPPLIALGGTCRTASAKGTREVPVEDFCTAPGKTILGEGEILVSFHLPAPRPRSGAAYQRFIPRNEMDIAVAGAASAIELAADGKTIAEIRVSLAAVAPTPLRVESISKELAGKPASDETFERAAKLARDVARPINDMRGQDWQRIHLAGVLTRRTLQIALERARASS